MSIKKFEDFINENHNPNKDFLVYDLSGRSAKPYKLDKEHIESTWDLDETDDDSEITLRDFINDCSIGSEWCTNSVKMVCL